VTNIIQSRKCDLLQAFIGSSQVTTINERDKKYLFYIRDNWYFKCVFAAICRLL